MIVPKFSLKLRKNVYLLKPKSSLGSLQGTPHYTILLRSESLIYYFLGFVWTFRTAIFLFTSFQNYKKDN